MSDDLIRRSDAIGAIINHCENGCYYRVDNWCPQCQRKEFQEAINAIPSADRSQGWIPCSEGLPSNFSEDEMVLATTDVDGDRVIPMFAFDVKSFYLKGYVSAWMPLPKPWEGADG